MSAVYIVTIAKWNTKGAHRWKVVGISHDLDVAQALMVKKFLYIVSHNGQLVDNRIYYKKLFADEREQNDFVEYDPGYNAFDLLEVLENAQLANQYCIYIPRGDKGFAVRIEESHCYTDDNLDVSNDLWDQHKAEKNMEKGKKYC